MREDAALKIAFGNGLRRGIKESSQQAGSLLNAF